MVFWRDLRLPLGQGLLHYSFTLYNHAVIPAARIG